MRAAGLCLLAVGMAALTAGRLPAEQITLDVNTLPSAQGWEFNAYGGSAAEGSVFTAGGGALKQDTIGTPYAGSVEGGIRYNLYGVIDPTQPFTITTRARVLAEEGGDRSFGFFFGAFTGAEEFAIGVGATTVQDANLQYVATGLDNSQFHEYRLDARPGDGYDLYIDGVLAATGAARLIDWPNSLALGDGTALGNARAEVTFYQFSQGAGGNPTVQDLPEPSALLLCSLGGSSLGMMWWRKRRKKPALAASV